MGVATPYALVGGFCYTLLAYPFAQKGAATCVKAVGAHGPLKSLVTGPSLLGN